MGKKKRERVNEKTHSEKVKTTRCAVRFFRGGSCFLPFKRFAQFGAVKWMWGEPSHPSPNSVVFVILLLLKPEPFFPAVGSSFELIFNTGAGSDFQGVSFLWMVFFSPFPPKTETERHFLALPFALRVLCVEKHIYRDGCVLFSLFSLLAYFGQPRQNVIDVHRVTTFKDVCCSNGA